MCELYCIGRFEKLRLQEIWDSIVFNLLKRKVSVFSILYCSLIYHIGTSFDKPEYHGKDGLGDMPDLKDPDMNLLKETHAVQALIQLVNQNPGEVVIIALGPLSNIALASNMDAGFFTQVKEIYLMGGCVHGKGNHWVSAEFNFGADPEAAYIVLNEKNNCPVSLMSWEACLDHVLEWEFYDRYVGTGTKKAEFMKKISSKIREYEGNGPFITCDPFPICAAVQPQIVLKEKLVYATVELKGGFTRGQMVVDWYGLLKKDSNVRLLEKLDLELFMAMMLHSVK